MIVCKNCGDEAKYHIRNEEVEEDFKGWICTVDGCTCPELIK